MIPIAIVEDHPMIRASIKMVLNQVSPGTYQFYEYENGQILIDRFPTEHYTPAIVLMDLRMPQVNGYDATAWLKKHYPSIPVLVLTDIDNAQAFIYFVRCGANGYVSKQEFGSEGQFHIAVERVIAGQDYFKDPALYAFAKKRMAMPLKELKEGLDSLNEEERKVIRYLCLEKTYNENAKEHYVSPSGYKKRLSKVFKKIGVHSTTALHKFAFEIGLVSE